MARKLSAKMLKAIDAEQQSWELRCHGATYDQIAQAVGFTDRSAARKAVKRALKRYEPDEETKAEEIKKQIHQYDILMRAYMPGASARDRDDAMIVLKLMKQRAELLGLDSAQRLEHRHDISTQHDVTVTLEAKISRFAESLTKTKLLQEPDSGATTRDPVQLAGMVGEAEPTSS